MGTSIAQEILVPRAVSPKAETEALTPQQRYQQEMERIWERVNQLPDGQKRVVMHQLVQFGKLPFIRLLKSFLL